MWAKLAVGLAALLMMIELTGLAAPQSAFAYDNSTHVYRHVRPDVRSTIPSNATALASDVTIELRPEPDAEWDYRGGDVGYSWEPSGWSK
jgi:hypothetical protein